MLQRSMRGWCVGIGFGLALAACGGASDPPASGSNAADAGSGGGGGGGGGGSSQPRLAVSGTSTTGGTGSSGDVHLLSPRDATNLPPWGLLCKYAMPLTPGETLSGQNTSPGGEPNHDCRPSNAPQHFYGFDLPPGMRATVTVTPSTQFTAVVRVMVSCDATECITDQQSPSPGAPAVVVVDSPSDQTVSKIVTVSGLDARDNGGYAISLTLTPLGSTGGGDGGTGGDGGDGGTTGTAAAPRQVAPLSTATVTSQRPTLHWALADGTQGARVEICADRACGTVEQRFDATGSSGMPASDLAPGVHFWRLHGTDASGAGTATSPVWSFYVGQRSVGDSSWGITPDYNGDGAPDLAALRTSYDSSGTQTTGVTVFTNTGSGLPAMPSYTFDVPAAGSVESVGDLDGDGYGDLAYSVYAGNYQNDVVVRYGGPGSLADARSTRIVAAGLGFGAGFGSTTAAGGDVNGDGYGDLLVCTGARAAVFFGGPGGVSTTPGATLQFTLAGSAWGKVRLAHAGDVNGDGYADVLAGYYNNDAENTAVFLYLGGPDLTVMPGVQLGTRYGNYAGLGAADVNGDGYADVGISSLSPVGFDVFYGSPTGVAPTAGTSLSFPGVGPDYAVALPGDYDGDGYGDFAFLNYNNQSTGPRETDVHVLHGGTGGLTALNDLQLVYDTTHTFYATWALSVGDANRDGYADVMVYGDDYWPGSSTSMIRVYNGSSSGVDDTVDGTLTWPGNVSVPATSWTSLGSFANVH